MLVATVLTACGIETIMELNEQMVKSIDKVATVLTACGIETVSDVIYGNAWSARCNSTYRLRY